MGGSGLELGLVGYRLSATGRPTAYCGLMRLLGRVGWYAPARGSIATETVGLPQLFFLDVSFAGRLKPPAAGWVNICLTRMFPASLLLAIRLLTRQTISYL